MAELVSRVDAFLRRFEVEEKKRLFQAGNLMKNEVRRLMTESPRSGREYRKLRATQRARGRTAGQRRRGDYIIHRASAPGEPPAPDTGTLRRAVNAELVLDRAGWQANVGVTQEAVKYAAPLEFGTRRIRPRPAWRPAYQNLRGQLAEILGRPLPDAS
jgi:hypothetical protein